MKEYKFKWSAEGTATVEGESRALAQELLEMMLFEDLEPPDAVEFEVTKADTR